jgi:hypothetical protein
MKPQHIVFAAVALLAGLLVGTWLIGSEVAAPDKQVAELLARIEQLEKRVEQLEQRSPMIAVPHGGNLPYSVVPPATAPMPSVPSIPRDWSAREFNGMYYYIVPLDSMKAAVPRQSTAK